MPGSCVSPLLQIARRVRIAVGLPLHNAFVARASSQTLAFTQLRASWVAVTAPYLGILHFMRSVCAFTALHREAGRRPSGVPRARYR